MDRKSIQANLTLCYTLRAQNLTIFGTGESMKKDFIAITDYTTSELQGMLDLAVDLKKEWMSGGNQPILKNKVMSMIFQKPSLRTRVSFDMAMRHLGGDALYLSPSEIGLGKTRIHRRCSESDFWLC